MSAARRKAGDSAGRKSGRSKSKKKQDEAELENRGGDGDGDGTGTTADRMAKQQREISISEFFTKNRHLLGFDNPRKALLTTVKEAVDNSLDACEEAGILPTVKVQISKVEGKDDRFVVAIEDNGPGIQKQQIPKIFGKLLYGSKFHRLRMSRGQQGIGISAAGMYGQLTAGKGTIITSRTGARNQAHYYEIQLNTQTNNPEILKDKEVDWEPKHGTRVEIELEGRYHKGKQSVEEYLTLTAIANPHVEIEFTGPDGDKKVFERAAKQLPIPPKEIKPHPYGVELGMLINMLKQTKQKTVQAFLAEEFSRVSRPLARKIAEAAGLKATTKPADAANKSAEPLYKAVQDAKILNPATDCLSPIGDDLILKGLKREVEAEFYTSTTRSPAVYRGNPFQIEVGLAFGKAQKAEEESDDDNDGQGELFDTGAKGKTRSKGVDSEPSAKERDPEQLRLLRFANRVPLMFQQAGCAVTKSIVQTAWKNYGLSQSRGALPMGEVVCMVHVASVWVPFTSESKEAVAHYPEIIKEIKLAVQDCGRRLGAYLKRRLRDRDNEKKKDYIKKYIPVIVEALDEIVGLNGAQKKSATDNLAEILERSRG